MESYNFGLNLDNHLENIQGNRSPKENDLGLNFADLLAEYGEQDLLENAKKSKNSSAPLLSNVFEKQMHQQIESIQKVSEITGINCNSKISPLRYKEIFHIASAEIKYQLGIG